MSSNGASGDGSGPPATGLPRLLVMCGPTAAGKSALALQLAAERAVTIVSADSRQIYRRFDIGTAKPTPAERALVPHAGIDLTDPTQRFSSVAWATDAARAIDDARAAGRIPLVVGGAGFYIRALVTPEPTTPRYDVHYLLVDPGSVLREWIEHRADAMLAGGWPDEVRTLDEEIPDEAPAWQASGYAAVRAMIRGAATAAATRTAVVIATRQYAKRQRTWFRHQLPAERVTRVDPRHKSALATGLALADRPPEDAP